MEITCVVVDDEPIARKGLKSYIEKTAFLSLAGECETVFELNALLKTTRPDVIFLDIEMPGITGIEYLSMVTDAPKVIIVSAYEQYALKGYELQVFDYLLKPVSAERFMKAVNRLHDQLTKESVTQDTDHIFIKTDKKVKKIVLKEILFIESLENYVTVYTLTSKEMVHCTLKMIEAHLPAARFVHIHRSYIVNTENIEALEGNLLEVGPYKIPVARELKQHIYNNYIVPKLVTRTGKKQ